MSFLFNDKEKNGIEEIKFGKKLNKNRVITRAVTLKILDTAIIYNDEEDYYDTLATCSNENNIIETISIEGFEIHENVIELKGAYIDYEQDSDINSTGTIYYL
ncbi:hypothetical protein KTC96_05495 [Clostridium estertheticum]|uniref:hypothetical protein n=1 Tax=Clostridium estertheticum TaxID=238834 RepID=UPI001C7DAC1A|nr:hypothetical protein [Clostridium estertheticum]MBX4262654.1 hypothetical protein [Clostridium estertheticum]WLC71473.1 hypothetical protein KTC96_05495 [Clostridium estertheticum]